MRRNLHQLYAEFAYTCVSGVKGKKGQEDQTKYKTVAKKVPALIHNNGLIATAIFLKKKSGMEEIAYKHMEEWYKEHSSLGRQGHKENDFCQYLWSLSSQELRHLTHEMGAVFTWIKNFSEAMIVSEGEDNGK